MVPVQLSDAVDEQMKPTCVTKFKIKVFKGEVSMAMDAAPGLCTKNGNEIAFRAESTGNKMPVDCLTDQKVEIINCTSPSTDILVKGEDLEATEHSSSFDDTFSGTEDELYSENGDAEVDSLFGPPPIENAAVFNGLTRVFKKKKVTGHWRKFISPLMWRCRWLELRMKELQNQASKYDNKLALLNHEKGLQSKMIELDGSASRSVPLSSRSCRRKAMKRRRRKRYEDTYDASSYMSNHVIFSYYENRRTETDGHSFDDDHSDVVDENVKASDNTDWLHGAKACDNFLEQIFLDIEAVRSRVLELSSRLGKAICKKTKETSTMMPVEVPHTPPHNASDCEMEDVVMAGSTVSSYGDATEVDIVESTVGLLSAADIPLSPQSADDILLIHNQAVEEEYQSFEVVGHPINKHRAVLKEEAGLLSEEDESAAPNSVPREAGPEGTNAGGVSPQQAILKPCSAAKRRGGRKPAARRRDDGPTVASTSSWRSGRIRKPKL